MKLITLIKHKQKHKNIVFLLKKHNVLHVEFERDKSINNICLLYHICQLHIRDLPSNNIVFPRRTQMTTNLLFTPAKARDVNEQS